MKEEYIGRVIEDGDYCWDIIHKNDNFYDILRKYENKCVKVTIELLDDNDCEVPPFKV